MQSRVGLECTSHGAEILGGNLYNTILRVITEMQIDFALMRAGFGCPFRGRIWDINLVQERK